MKRPKAPNRTQKEIMKAAGFEPGCYAVVGSRNGLLTIVSRSDERNIIRIDEYTRKRISG